MPRAACTAGPRRRPAADDAWWRHPLAATITPGETGRARTPRASRGTRRRCPPSPAPTACGSTTSRWATRPRVPSCSSRGSRPRPPAGATSSSPSPGPGTASSRSIGAVTAHRRSVRASTRWTATAPTSTTCSRPSELEDVTLVGQSMGGNAIWAMVRQFGTGGIRDIVIVDQTPKMLNTADWPYGFYDYDESERRHLLRDRHPRPRPPSREVEGPRAHLAGAEGDGGPEGRPARLHDGRARAAQRPRQARLAPVIAGLERPAFFIAGAESEFWPAEHAAASAALNAARLVDGDRARRARRQHRAAAAVQRGAARVPAALSAREPAGASAQRRRHSCSLTQSHASRCARCTASPIHSELS